MAGCKNKTTHKHNMKVVRDEPFKSDEYFMEGRFIVKKCLCGHWTAGIVPTYNFIYVPDNCFTESTYKPTIQN